MMPVDRSQVAATSVHPAQLRKHSRFDDLLIGVSLGGILVLATAMYSGELDSCSATAGFGAIVGAQGLVGLRALLAMRRVMRMPSEEPHRPGN